MYSNGPASPSLRRTPGKTRDHEKYTLEADGEVDPITLNIRQLLVDKSSKQMKLRAKKRHPSSPLPSPSPIKTEFDKPRLVSLYLVFPFLHLNIYFLHYQPQTPIRRPIIRLSSPPKELATADSKLVVVSICSIY